LRLARWSTKSRFGLAFQFIEDAAGDLIFRPVKASPKRDLVDHLASLKGLEIPARRHHGPPRL
jgi:hypothetical protein